MAYRYTHDDSNPSCNCFHSNYDEDHHEDINPKCPWPFASEEEEHRHFDNLQRVADIRSAR